MKFSILIIIFLLTYELFAQGVIISEDQAADPSPDAILEVESTTKGLLLPRMTLAQRNSIVSPSEGLLIYQNNGIEGFYYFDGNIWVPIAPSFTETDPQVGTIDAYFLPKWGGAQLVQSSVSENGGLVTMGNLLINSRINNSAQLFLDDNSGNRIAYIGNSGLGGALILYGQNEEDKIFMNIQSNDAGYLEVLGSNGNRNIRLTFLGGNGDHGYLEISDAVGDQQAAVFVNAAGQGIVTADLKNFIEPHPNDPTKEIYYASLEGPEAAMYMSGTARPMEMPLYCYLNISHYWPMKHQ